MYIPHIYKYTNIYKGVYFSFSMDRRTTYFKIKEMLKDRAGSEITIHELRKLLAIHIGIRKSDDYLKLMVFTDLIKDIGNCRFKILKQKELGLKDFT